MRIRTHSPDNKRHTKLLNLNLPTFNIMRGLNFCLVESILPWSCALSSRPAGRWLQPGRKEPRLPGSCLLGPNSSWLLKTVGGGIFYIFSDPDPGGTGYIRYTNEKSDMDPRKIRRFNNLQPTQTTHKTSYQVFLVEFLVSCIHYFQFLSIPNLSCL